MTLRTPLAGHSPLRALIPLLLLAGLTAEDAASPAWPPLLRGEPKAVAVDAQGNRYVVGINTFAWDADPRPGHSDAVIALGNYDLLVTRIDADGRYAWSQVVGGTNVDYAGGVTVAGGRVFVSGWTNSADLGIGGIGASNPRGGFDGFVAALDAATGQAISTFGAGGLVRIGGAASDYVNGMVVDGQDLFIAFTSDSTDLSIGTQGGFSSSAYLDGFVAALDAASGALRTSFSGDGVQRIAGASDEDALRLALRGGTLYVAGEFMSSNTGIGSAGTLACTGARDVFIAALDATSGAAVTAFSGDGLQRIGGTQLDNLDGLVAEDTTLYLVGDFTGLVLGIDGAGTMQSVGGTDVFVAALTRSTGAAKPGFGTGGLQRIGGSHQDHGRAMVLASGTLVIAGEVWSNNLGIGGAGSLGSRGLDDGLLIGLDAGTGAAAAGFGSGGLLRFGGAGGDRATALALAAGRLSVVGSSANGPATMDDGGLGWVATQGWNGLLLTLTAATGDPVQDLRFAEIPAKTVVSPPFSLDVVPAATGNAVTITSSAPSVATVDGTTVTVHGAGTTRITVTQAGGAGLPPASVAHDLVVVADSAANAWPPMLRGTATAVALDDSRNRYVVGTFSGTQDFDPRPDSIDLVSARGVDVFVTRFTHDGDYSWTRVIGSSLNDTAVGVVTINHTIYVCGAFAGSDLGVGGSGTLASLGSDDLFVAVLDGTTGNLAGAFNGGIQRIGGSSTEYGRAICTDGLRIFVAGETWSPDVGIGALGALGSVNASLDVVVAALDPSTGLAATDFSGDGLQRIGGQNSDYVYGMTVGATGLVVVGKSDSLNLGIGDPGTLLANGDAYVAGLSATTGAALTAFSGDGLLALGSSGTSAAYGATVANGNLYVVGEFSGTLTIDGAGGLVAITNSDAFIAAVNATTGAPLTSFSLDGMERIGGTSLERGRAVVADASWVFVLGESSSGNLGIATTGTWASRGGQDLFVASLGASTGAIHTVFNGNGLQQVGGSAAEYARGLVLSGNELLVLGASDSDSVALGSGTPSWGTNGGWSSLLLALSPGTAAQHQDLGLAPITAKAVTAPPFALQVTPGPSGKPVVITCDKPWVATVSGTEVTIVGAGNATIYATQAGSGSYAPVTVSRPLVVLDDEAQPAWPPLLRGPLKALAVDAAGNRYVAGDFSTGYDFDPRAGSLQVLGPYGSSDVFVTRIDADGSYAWTQVIGGGAADQVFALAVADGVVYVAGDFASSDLGIGGPGTMGVVGGIDGFIVALAAADGTAVTTFGSGGIQRIGGTTGDSIRALAVSGHVYAAGVFASTDLGIGGAGSVAPVGFTDAMVVAVSSTTGTAVTGFSGDGIQRIGGAGYDLATCLHLAGGRLLVGGSVASGDLGVGAAGGATSLGLTDGFIAALDPADGSAVTAFSGDGIQIIGGTSADEVTALASHAGSLYAAGTFASSDLGVGAIGSLATTAGNDAFAAKLSLSDGSAISAFGSNGVQRIGGANTDSAAAIAANAGGVIVAGRFQSATLGIAGAGRLANLGGADAFVARLDPVLGVGDAAFSGDGLERIGGSGTDGAAALHLDASGGLLVAGELRSTNGGIGVPGGWGGATTTAWSGFLVSLAAETARQQPYLAMAPLRAAVAGGPAFDVVLTQDPPGAAVTVTSSKTYAASVSGRTITPLAVNTVVITATQPAGGGLEPASASQVLQVVEDAVADDSPPVLPNGIRALALDAAGNRYVTGEYTRGQDFDLRAGHADAHANHGGRDVFVTRINADGSYGWTQVIAGSGTETANAIAVDDGSVVVVGTFTSDDLGISTWGSVRSFGGSDVFVARLATATGAPATGFASGGLQQIGSPLDDEAGDLCVSASAIQVVGTFRGTGLGIGIPGVVAAVAGRDAFIAALERTSGAPLTAFSGDGLQIIGGNGDDRGYAITWSGSHLVVAGSFASTDLGIGSVGSMSVSGDVNGFIAKLAAPTGAAEAGFASGGLQRVAVGIRAGISDVAVADGIIYATGSPLSLGLGVTDAFVVALMLDSGAPVTAFSDDGVQAIAGGLYENGCQLVVTADAVIIAGDFTSTDLGIGGSGTLTASGERDIFLAMLSRSDGSPLTSFSGDGVERIGGDNTDTVGGLALSAGGVLVAGTINSRNAGYGGIGSWDGALRPKGLLLAVPLNGVLGVPLDVVDTTVVVDGDPHHAAVISSPRGLAVNVTYNGSATPPSAIGTYTVQATITQPGFSGSASGTLTIAKATLTVTAANKTRRRGAVDPPFTATYSGFIGGDTAAIITTPTTLSTTATVSSASGRYPITGSGTVAPGYVVKHLAGSLLVYDFGITAATLRGTTVSGATVTVDGTPATHIGTDWEATGEVGDDTDHVFSIDAIIATPPNTGHETITIEAVDLPLGGG